MKLFEDFKIKFERPDWSRNLELGLIDLLAEDITRGQKSSVFGRKDTPSVEQIPPNFTVILNT